MHYDTLNNLQGTSYICWRIITRIVNNTLALHVQTLITKFIKCSCRNMSNISMLRIASYIVGIFVNFIFK